MEKEFDELWRCLESLSDEKVESAYARARVEMRYRVEMCGLIALYLLALGALFVGFRALVRAYDLGPIVRVTFVALQLVAAGVGARGLFALNRRMYERAILRVLRGC